MHREISVGDDLVWTKKMIRYSKFISLCGGQMELKKRPCGLTGCGRIWHIQQRLFGVGFRKWYLISMCLNLACSSGSFARMVAPPLLIEDSLRLD